MQLLSQDSERWVFHLDKSEVQLLRQLVKWGFQAERIAGVLSRDPACLPGGATEEFTAAQRRRSAEHRTFLEQIFAAKGTHLQAPAAGGKGKGYGLTLTRAEVERLLQALNEIKLAHWERLGCPDEDAAELAETPENRVSELVIELSNQAQSILLRALENQD